MVLGKKLGKRRLGACGKEDKVIVWGERESPSSFLREGTGKSRRDRDYATSVSCPVLRDGRSETSMGDSVVLSGVFLFCGQLGPNGRMVWGVRFWTSCRGLRLSREY